jgi:hypothetical protein
LSVFTPFDPTISSSTALLGVVKKRTSDSRCRA